MLVFLTVEECLSKNNKIEYNLARIEEGERAALGELYELVKTDVYAYALSVLKNREDAEDVMHDTFVRIYRYASRYEPKGRPMAWIITIAMNLAKRHRQLKMRHVSLDESIATTEQISEVLADNIAKSDFVRRLLRCLGDIEREIVVLHAVSGFKHKEIASILGISIGTVLSKYNRAIKKLRELAEEE